jgi:RND family efflux transporter MFP subunit
MSADEKRPEAEKPETDKPWPSEPQPGIEDVRIPTDTTEFRRTGRLVAIGVLAVLAIGLGYGAWRAYQSHEAVMATAQQYRDFVPSLRVAKVKPSDETITVTLPATTLAYTTANMFARVSGYISKRKVDIGDRVKKGDLLAYISAPEIEYQLAQSEATLLETQATVRQLMATMELARITDERNVPLVERGFVSALNGDTYRLNLKSQEEQVQVAQANVAAQAAQVEVARQQKDYQSVVAPFDGVITQRNVDVGDLMQGDATSGTFMFTVMQSDVIRTQVYVPQDQAFGLAPGVKTTVHVPTMPGQTFPGTVTRIADSLDPTTRTLLTEIDIPNPEGNLQPGTYVTVELSIPRKTPSLLVPAQGIIFNQNGMQVAVVKDGKASFQKIEVTRDLGTQIEVDDGVKAGDQVILNPPVNLENGQKVRIRKETKKAQAKPGSEKK